jgi:hypothetical protein
MRLMVDTSNVSFMVSKAAEPKREMGRTGQQKVNIDGEPQWTVELFALDEAGGEVIRVTVAGIQPKVSQGQAVTVQDLEAVPWSNNGRSGVAYRVTSIAPLAQPKAA